MKTAAFGVGLTLLGGVTTAFGWAFQKKAYNQVQGTKDSVLSKFMWWVGLVCVILTQPLYIVGVSMANQSTIGVVGPFALIANILLARIYLKEKISKWEYISIFLLIPGTIVTLSYASMENNR